MVFIIPILGFATKLLVVPLLNIFGFSAAGPVAGSLAALYQAYIGNVAAGSLFALAQAAAMAV